MSATVFVMSIQCAKDMEILDVLAFIFGLLIGLVDGSEVALGNIQCHLFIYYKSDFCEDYVLDSSYNVSFQIL